MVLDINKYITIEENGEAGQNANGKWYCKKLPFKDDKDLDVKIGRINAVFNKYNKDIEKKEKNTPKPPKKEKK